MYARLYSSLFWHEFSMRLKYRVKDYREKTDKLYKEISKEVQYAGTQLFPDFPEKPP